jgi:NAD(P)H-nitrite reductase large subunit
MKHVIIGSGAAGIAAVKTIRSINKTDEIIMISSDETIYSRCMIHKYVDNQRDIAHLNFVSDNFFSENNITLCSSEYVSQVDAKNSRVLLLQNKSLSYDKLLIATGSDSVIPNIRNMKSATNMYGFRHLKDAKSIREKAINAEKILIVGAGLAGLDIAYALLKLKKSVTVIEMAPQIMPLQLDSTAAAVYQKLFEQNGCTFKLNSKIIDTTVDEKNAITHVTLETGETLHCDLIVVVAGVKPSIDFLVGSGIECERGIKTDEHLRTSYENIYAAGTVTALGEIWSCAVKQGEVAAKNMCGIKTQYTDTFTAKTSINFFDLPAISIGKINPDNADTVIIKNCSSCYQKIILKNNSIIGVILQGNIYYSGIWQELIKNNIDTSKLEKPLWNISFADFYCIDEKGNYKYKTC